jgi:hypothetical protein
VARLLLLVVISIEALAEGEIFTDVSGLIFKQNGEDFSIAAQSRNDIQNEGCFYEKAVAKKCRTPDGN